jgi:dienelactone hydrolase
LTPVVWRVLETELTAAGVPHDLKIYPRAKHAFFNDTLEEIPRRRGGGLVAASARLFAEQVKSRHSTSG